MSLQYGSGLEIAALSFNFKFNFHSHVLKGVLNGFQQLFFFLSGVLPRVKSVLSAGAIGPRVLAFLTADLLVHARGLRLGTLFN